MGMVGILSKGSLNISPCCHPNLKVTNLPTIFDILRCKMFIFSCHEIEIIDGVLKLCFRKHLVVVVGILNGHIIQDSG